MQSLPILLLLLIPLTVINAQQLEREHAKRLNDRFAELVIAKDRKGLNSLFQMFFSFTDCPNHNLTRDQFVNWLLSLNPPVTFFHHVVEATFGNGVLEMRSFYKIQGKPLTIVFRARFVGSKWQFISGKKECV